MRSTLTAAAAACLLTVLPGIASGQGAAPLVVPIKAQDGSARGTLTLTDTPHGLLLSAVLTGLPDGPHGYHVHETGTCAGNFESAGGHFNPTGKAHGFMAADGAHAGDMGNFVSVGGTAGFDMLNPSLTLGAGTGSVNDADGSALVIHAMADDYASQPAGKSGERIACAVIAPAP